MYDLVCILSTENKVTRKNITSFLPIVKKTIEKMLSIKLDDDFCVDTKPNYKNKHRFFIKVNDNIRQMINDYYSKYKVFNNYNISLKAKNNTQKKRGTTPIVIIPETETESDSSNTESDVEIFTSPSPKIPKFSISDEEKIGADSFSNPYQDELEMNATYSPTTHAEINKILETNLEFDGIFTDESEEEEPKKVTSVLKKIPKKKKIITLDEKVCEDLSKKETPKKKAEIPDALKSLVWKRDYGLSMYGVCLCCCSELISRTNGDCGHIESEKMSRESNKGSGVNADNLRYICANCNRSMSSKHMEDFRAQYHFPKNPNEASLKFLKSLKGEISIMIRKIKQNMKTKK